MPGLIGSLIEDAANLHRLAEFFADAGDEWDRLRIDVVPRTFGRGSHRAFDDYFRGPSRVAVRSLDELCAWLRDCQCASDASLFFESDYWQHPVTFEQLRKGDCEDHALWAWRKLAELSVPALFMAGRWRGVAHTWVLIEAEAPNPPHILESTAKHEPMLQPLPVVRPQYCPAVGVDASGRTYVYRGYRRFAGDSCP